MTYRGLNGVTGLLTELKVMGEKLMMMGAWGGDANRMWDWTDNCI